ncbi:MAG: porin [Bosea sp.]|nr:porin [Bosea sp. (in: a-proteobacteria)]
MRARQFLLLTAAAFVTVGTAHAADLTVAEPVDYVKVCDAFGEGFFYSPGTDTCIKVGGYVKFGTAFGDTDFGDYNDYYPGSKWDNFYTEASIQLTASSVTEFGNLTGFIDMRAQTGNQGNFSSSAIQVVNSETNTAYLDSGYLQLGPVKAGYFTSLFDFGRGYTDTEAFGSDTTSDHIEFTYATGGFAFAFSIEDQRDRGAVGATDGLVEEDGQWSVGGQNNIPDLVGAISYSSGIVSAKLAAAYVNDAVSIAGSGTAFDPYVADPETGWAIGGGLEFNLDAITKGDAFFVSASYGNNANSYTGIAGGTSVADLGGFEFDELAAAATGSSWSALASYKHNWSDTVYSAVTGGYASYDGDGSFFGDYSLTAWRGVLSTGWTPVTGLDLMLDGSYSQVDESDDGDGDAWAVNLWMQRSW